MRPEDCVMAVIRASRPTFNNSHDTLAFSVHAYFLSCGFLLTSVGPPAVEDSAFSSSTSVEVSVDGWSSVDEDYAFVYHNPKDSKNVHVRCIAMHEKLLIDAFKDEEESEQPVHVHVEISTEDYVEKDDTDKSNYKEDYYKNFAKLVKTLRTELVLKLMKGEKAADSSGNEKVPSSSKSEGLRTNPYRVDPVAAQIPYPAYGYTYIYPTIPVFHGGSNAFAAGPPVPVWHGRGADAINLVGPAIGGPGFRGGQHPQPRSGAERGRGVERGRGRHPYP